MQPRLIEPDEEMLKKAAEETAAYRKLAQDRRTAEDEMLARCYRELDKGRTLLNVDDSIIDAGLNHQELPKLAIARAGHEFVFLNQAHETFQFTTACDQYGRPEFRRRGGFHHYRIAWPELKSVWKTWRSPVPMIPFQFRTPYKLTNYHVLWEVEEWNEAPQEDPFMLRHLIGPMFVVLAHWDLTPLESAVLQKRFRPN